MSKLFLLHKEMMTVYKFKKKQLLYTLTPDNANLWCYPVLTIQLILTQASVDALYI